MITFATIKLLPLLIYMFLDDIKKQLFYIEMIRVGIYLTMCATGLRRFGISSKQVVYPLWLCYLRGSY